jgi:nucleotide-binding universal stress UspA family protein
MNAMAHDTWGSSLTEIGGKGIKTILVPTDFSESSNLALRTAIDLAQKENARIYLLHVQPVRQVIDDSKLIEKQLAQFPEAKSVEIVAEIKKGKIHEEILKVQSERNIDLIVIAPHRQPGFIYTLFRSITEKVKKEAQCSVLVMGA